MSAEALTRIALELGGETADALVAAFGGVEVYVPRRVPAAARKQDLKGDGTMLDREYAGLKPGDLVRHKTCADAMVVVEIVAGVPVLARFQAIYNPREWDRVDSGGRVISSPDQ